MEESKAEEEMFLSQNTLVGTTYARTTRLRALVGKQVMLILLDSGSSHIFINTDMVDKLSVKPAQVPPMMVKVANGEMLSCTAELQGFSWWIQGHTFQHDIKVLHLGGYDAVLGMDRLE